jgi:hypothetical protein
LPGSANAVLSPGLLRFQANAQALANFGQFANVPFFAFPGFNALAGAAASNALARSFFLGSTFSPFFANPFVTQPFNPGFFNPGFFNPFPVSSPGSFSPVLLPGGGF